MRIALFISAAIAYACQPVDGPNITGKDLAAADPSFAGIDPAAIVGASPLPGVRRIMQPLELNKYGPAASPVCFERATTLLTEDEVNRVLVERASSLQRGSPVHLQLLDFTKTPVPKGLIDFSPAGPDQSGLWRGRVKYDERRTFPIWAKVRITTEQTWLEAAELLQPGKPISESQLKKQRGPRSPFGPQPIIDIAGRVPLRAIKPCETIFASMLTTPRDIERGDKVAVEVVSGEAHLLFDAIAESPGRLGESVLIKNPENGRRFQARVESKGKVLITK